MFLAKKIIGELASPLSLAVLFLVLGVALLWLGKRERLAKLVVTAAALLLVTAAYGWLGGPALRALERDYLPLGSVPPGMKWVVVLGGGSWSDPTLPPRARLTEATLARLVEGVRLQRQLPGAKLVLSGAAVYGAGSDAESMSALAVDLGVPRESIVLDDKSEDTEAQARIMRQLLKGEPCILVTSAVHMRRSLALFRKQGVLAVPAPADYLSQSHAGWTPAHFFPGSRGLQGADAAAHEYLGLAWARLTGRI